jgi:pSer/pThr/pTyr-binding forkhead associated (FHA) protein
MRSGGSNMSKLIVYDQNGNVVSERQIDRERIKIGRRADSDVPLEHISVSGEHALITTIRNDSFIQDLGSTNGVRVNGRLVKNHHLQDGDEISIATFILKFHFEPWVMPDNSWVPTVANTIKNSVTQEAPHNGATLLEIGMNHSAGLSRDMTGNRMFDNFVVKQDAAAELGAEKRMGVLRLMGGAGTGKQLELDKPVLTLGKPGMQTAVIGKKSAGYFLTYVEGGSYPMVNGVEVGSTPYQLKDHDILEFAGTRLEFYYK